MKQARLPYPGWSLPQLHYWTRKAARKLARARLEEMSMLDLILGAQFDKRARNAANKIRAELKRGAHG